MSTEINIGDFLTTRAFLNPRKEALYDVHTDRRVSYRELNERANRCANAMRALGLGKGDRVALIANNGHEFAECFFGPTKTGLVVMPLNWRLTAAELAYILRDGDPGVVVFDEQFTPVVEQLRDMGESAGNVRHWVCIGDTCPEFAVPYEDFLAGAPAEEPQDKAGPDDNIFIMYTSGTTGNPKGVVHTHHTVFWALLTLNRTADAHFDDRYLLMLPMFHVGALTPLMSSTYNARPLVPEVLVDGDRFAVVRERIGTADMMRHESIPDWLTATDAGGRRSAAG